MSEKCVIKSFPNLAGEKLDQKFVQNFSGNAWTMSNPWPPLPSNLNKRQVFRKKLSLDEDGPVLCNFNGQIPAIFELTRSESSCDVKIKENKNNFVLDGKSDIELAIYWDRKCDDKVGTLRSKSAIPKGSTIGGQNKGTNFDDKNDKIENLVDIGERKNVEICNNQKPKSTQEIGIQVDTGRILSAALKSKYLCPLHGQYQQKVKKFAENSVTKKLEKMELNETQCPRLLKSLSCQNLMKYDQSRASINRRKALELKKCEVISTRLHDEGHDPGCPGSELYMTTTSMNERCGIDFQSRHDQIRKMQKRIRKSQSAKFFSSEYQGNFRHPGKIEQSEKRILRNKILSNCCFKKESIL